MHNTSTAIVIAIILSIVYVLPYLEKDWIAYEEEQLALEAEKKRLKLAKKEAKRV